MIMSILRISYCFYTKIQAYKLEIFELEYVKILVKEAEVTVEEINSIIKLS